MDAPKTILIVEDSKLLRGVLRGLLEAGGFVVLEAEDGQMGFDTATSKHPDLIVLDLMMPVMDGIEMYQKLRTDAWGVDVPVIILTATKTEKITSWLNAEHLDFFMKDNSMMDEVVLCAKRRLGLV